MDSHEKLNTFRVLLMKTEINKNNLTEMGRILQSGWVLYDHLSRPEKDKIKNMSRTFFIFSSININKDGL